LRTANSILPKSHIFVIATELAHDGVSCRGLSEFTPEQEGRLEKFLDTVLKSFENPGVTGSTEHQIDVRQNNR